MRSLGIYVSESPTGRVIEDWTYRAENVVFGSNEHGHEAATMLIRLSATDAFRAYDSVPGRHLSISNGVERPFVGRIEDRQIAADGLQITALGYQRAMSDIPYTALWSDKHYGRWRIVTDNDDANAAPVKWEIDNNNRLYMTPKANETIANTTQKGMMTYAAPHLGNRNITAFSCSYTLDAPANWQFRVLTCAYDFTGQSVANTVTSAGAPLSGTLNLTFLGTPRLLVEMRNNTGGGVKVVVDTGVYYLKLTNIRIKTTTSSAVVASEIAATLPGYVTGINATQLQNITAIVVEATTPDMEDVIFEDEYPADILNQLIQESASGSRWAWMVWEDRILQFHPRGQRGKAWYADLAELGINSSLDELANSVYGVYENGYGETERTANSDNLTSQSNYGLIRRGHAEAKSAVQATQQRDLLLADRQEITPTAAIVIERLTTAEGAIVPFWACRAGDVIFIRNLPTAYAPTLNKIRQFVVSSTNYDADEDRLSPALEIAPPGVATTLARLNVRSPLVRARTI